MKFPFSTLSALFVLLSGVFLFASEPVRTWRTKSGSEIDAEWDTSSDTGGEEIRLLKEGKKFRVRVDRLSEEDFNYVRARRAELAEGDSGDFVPEDEETPSGETSRGSSEDSSPSSSDDSSEIRPERSVTAKANRKFAVLVGVDEYEKLRNLRFATADVSLIRDQLLELGFEPENIFTLTSDSGVADMPLKRIIEERIGHVLDEAGPNDMIFIAFSGHGVQIDKTVYFCPQDSQEEIVNSALSVTDLIKRLESSPARFKWMVIDACRENPFKSRTANPKARNIQKLDDPPRGLVILQSCANTELSYEDEDLGHGLFSYNLVEGLKGAAADEEGKLTLMDVCKYTTDQTVKMSVQKFGKYQRPYMTGEMSDFIIVDGLLRDGLSREVWNEAEGLYQEACFLSRRGQYHEAQGKIDGALKLTEGATAESTDRKKYLDEEADIKERLEMQEQLEAEKKRRLEAEERARQSAGSQGGPPSVSSAEPSDESDTFVPSTTPAVRVSSLGTGTEAGEKKTITANGVDYTFCWCPAGSFTMGSPESEEDRDSDETEHRVTLSHGFWLLESEVTQEMWESVMGTNPSEGKGVGSQYPVYNVDWDDSQEFCLKLSALTGEKITLPSEAQWEYACRAGSKGPYAGTGKLNEMGWYSRREMYEVKGKTPNAWGLYDMHGNVWEWCSDRYDDYASGSVTDPEGPNSGSFRVWRGGGWYNNARECRSAIRAHGSPENRSNHMGFRPAAVSADQTAAISSEPPVVPDQSASPTSPAVRVSSLGKGTEAGEKKTITANGVDYTFCWCPAGSFTMGSPESEEDRDSDETEHRVTLSHGFWLLESEVTQEMWESVMGTTVSEQRDKGSRTWLLSGVGSNYPMYYVNWEESVEFCRKLSALTGEKITLPTEAQWEYACRAGSKGPYAGTGKLSEMGWCGQNSGRKTRKVEGKTPNAWGLYDMHGNVWEWCSDWYGDYPGGSVTDPSGPSSGSKRVHRGGSWDYWVCRSADRSIDSPTFRNHDLGLRPAAVPAD